MDKMNKNEFSKSEPQITNNFKRESYLVTKSNQLKVPVIFTNEIQNKNGYVIYQFNQINWNEL